MDSILQADLQAVSDKDQVGFTVTVPVVPQPTPPDEVVVFIPATPPVA